MDEHSWRGELKPVEKVMSALVHAQRLPIVGWVLRQVLCLIGVDVPPETLNEGLLLPHCASGVTLHRQTMIGRDVTIFQGVTIGRGDVWHNGLDYEGVTIEDDVILCAHAVVVSSGPGITVGRGSVVAAGAVLTQSTGEWEIWGGVPARKIGQRPPRNAQRA